jgi:hypothetical protein
MSDPCRPVKCAATDLVGRPVGKTARLRNGPGDEQWVEAFSAAYVVSPGGMPPLNFNGIFDVGHCICRV